MQCPSCGYAMEHVTVSAVLAGTADVVFCLRCRAFWFEQYETLHLTRAATLQIFKFISAQSDATPVKPLPPEMHCPKCGSLLLLTHDRQQSTSFQYWRCDNGHGRFTPFVDFLREKEFIKALTPEQINEIRQEVQIVSCSRCGAPIDLTKDSACPHCGAPLSMLDSKKMAEMAHGAALDAGQTPPPKPPLPDVKAILAASEMKYDQPHNLVDLGIQSFLDWLRDAIL